MSRVDGSPEVTEREAGATPARSVRRATSRRASRRRAIARDRQSDTKERIVLFLNHHAGSTTGDLAKALNLNSRSVASHLNQLAKGGAIVKAPRGYSMKPAK